MVLVNISIHHSTIDSSSLICLLFVLQEMLEDVLNHIPPCVKEQGINHSSSLISLSVSLFLSALQELIRKGIPHHFRAIVWQLLGNATDMPVKNQYSELLKMSSPCEKLIRRDIARTYPEHEFFKGQDSLGQEVLFNVMKVSTAVFHITARSEVLSLIFSISEKVSFGINVFCACIYTHKNIHCLFQHDR